MRLAGEQRGLLAATGVWNTVTGRTDAGRAGGSEMSVRRQQAPLQSFLDKGFSSPLLGFMKSDGSGGWKPDEESPAGRQQLVSVEVLRT